MIIGIDPGLSGGIVAGDGGSDPALVAKMPETEVDVVEVILSLQDATTVFIEKLPMMIAGAKVSPSSMAKLHRNTGILTGAVMALGMRLFEIDPRTWQKFFKLGTKNDAGGYTAWKNKLKGEAQKRFPKVKVTHANADALLIYEWARLTQKV